MHSEQSQSHYRILFRVLGISWTVNESSWQFILPKLVIGIVVALIASPADTWIANVVIGVIYGLLLLGLLILHIVGHIITSKFVTPQMTEARITPTLIQTRYDSDPDTLPPRIHLTRAIGGAVMNLLVGACSLIAWGIFGSHYLLYFAIANWILMVVILFPLPSVDGEVIWRELGKLGS